MLVQEWLIIFLARWHHFACKLPYGQAPQPGRLDVRLKGAEHLAALPRIVYALLRSPVLAARAPMATDRAAALHALWCSLGPESLVRAVHPALVAFDDPNQDQFTRQPLSRSFLDSGQGNVLLMDAFDTIIVMYRAHAASSLPFPPPAQSALRSLARQLAAARGIAPEVRDQKYACAYSSKPHARRVQLACPPGHALRSCGGFHQRRCGAPAGSFSMRHQASWSESRCCS